MRQLVVQLQSSSIGVVGVLNHLVHVKQDVHGAAVNAEIDSRLRNIFVVRTNGDGTTVLDTAPSWLEFIRHVITAQPCTDGNTHKLAQCTPLQCQQALCRLALRLSCTLCNQSAVLQRMTVAVKRAACSVVTQQST
eukprot:4702-Heterococcus_DN1.PRE.6